MYMRIPNAPGKLDVRTHLQSHFALLARQFLFLVRIVLLLLQRVAPVRSAGITYTQSPEKQKKRTDEMLMCRAMYVQ
jgi:hypothetical protein